MQVAVAPARYDTLHRRSVLPGIALCLAVAIAAACLQTLERRLFGAAWLETLVLAILAGACVRTAWTPGAALRPGIAFSAHTVLEIAVVLLGLSVNAHALLAIGPGLLAGIAAVVVLAIVAGYAIGRLLGLSHRLALLIACGNAICGNAAIAAVAPVIGAGGKDVGASIAFTAVIGVAVVLLLPLAIPLLQLSIPHYGMLAGLTVYAVPQVLAATAPAGAAAIQLGTLVKLARVLMLAPVIVAISLLPGGAGTARPKLHRMVPPFIVGFLALAAARCLGLVPAPVLHPASVVAGLLTIVSMAALGLSTDVRALAGAGIRAACAVILSLLALGGFGLGLISLV